MPNHAFRVAVTLVLSSVMVAGCITQRGASRILSRDAHYAPQMWNDRAYAIVATRLDNQELALSSTGILDCSGVLGADPGKVDTKAKCTTVDHLSGQTFRNAVDGYLEGRTQQIDKLCDAYMHTLAEMGDTSRWSRSQVNALADVGTMILGLAETPALQLAYLSAGKSIYNQSVDNLENYLLLAPSADKVQRLVDTAQASMRQQKASLRQTDDREFWGATSRWVQQYAALCTPRGIRGLLNDAIEDQTAPITARAMQEAANTLGVGMDTTLKIYAAEATVDTKNWPDLSNPIVLGSLAWRLRENPKADTPARNFINQQLGVELSTFLTTTIDTNPQKLQQVKAKLDSQRGRYDELIRTAQATEAAASAANKLQALEDKVKDSGVEIAKFETITKTLQGSLDQANQRAFQAEKAAEQAQKEKAQLEKTLATLQQQLPPPAPTPPMP